MAFRTWSAASLVVIAVVSLAGCGQGDGSKSQPAGPPTLAISGGADGPPTEPALDAPELRLRLTKGMRFPVRKTVRQTLVQGGRAVGNPVAGLSELRLLMGVTVENVTGDGRARLRARFERIVYQQDVGGRRFEFDSGRHPADLPPEAAVYAAMVGDGFSFWIGANNRIEERIDFDAFLARCLSQIPPDERDRVTSRIAETTGDENLANFIDDGVGLLPLRANHGATAAAGDVWRRERQIVRPVRLYVAESCTLARLDAAAADIDVTGTIGASETFDTVEEAGGVAQVRVRGGHSLGHCRVDRATGLPLESRIERLADLRVRLPDGRELDQTKRIETTIEAFPAVRDAGKAAPPRRVR